MSKIKELITGGYSVVSPAYRKVVTCVDVLFIHGKEATLRTSMQTFNDDPEIKINSWSEFQELCKDAGAECSYKGTIMDAVVQEEDDPPPMAA